MSKKKNEEAAKEPRRKTPTFLLELPLQVDAGQAKGIRGHLEAGRAFYNAVLSEGQRRLRQMRADPAWQAARAIPRTHKQERQAAFSALREQYGFSEYALHEYARQARVSWIAEHLDAVLAQTLATRAYQALNRVCVGKARRVRFKSRGRGLSSIENKRNDTGLRFVLDKPEEGKQGFLVWKDDQLAALIDWNDPVVKYGLDHRIKYARLSNYDERGRIKKTGKKQLHWKSSRTYEKMRQRRASKERKLASHRKSLHGRLVHEIVAVGNTVIIEKSSYKAWQKQYGRSVGLRAPGMFIELLRRTGASYGRHPG